MNRKHLIGVTMAAMAASLGWSCTMDPYLMTPEEEYVRAFIKDFGLVDSEQDWNTADNAKVKIDLGTAQPDLVKIYTRKGEKYYLVASLQGITGNMDVPVDVPKGTEDVLVSVDGSYYMGKIDTPILCTGTPSKVKSRSVDLSRSSLSEETRQFEYQPKNPAYEFSTTMSTGETYGIKVDTVKNEGYRYFNAQQMGPIIGNTKNVGGEKVYEFSPWPSYRTFDGEYIENNTGDTGLLPEKGKENATMRTTDPRVIDDFVYIADNGEFYITPLFYGSNQTHVLGVFLLDPVTEQPLMAADGETVIGFPIFENKHDDDIKLKLGSDDLTYDGNTQWDIINKLWQDAPIGVNSYFTDKQRLVKSRIYHVKLTYNGKPWTGKFGFYIDYKFVQGSDASFGIGGRKMEGRHYSMRSLNTYYSTKKDYDASGTSLPVGTKFNYCYAATYEHPISKLQLMSFEDLAITHPGPNDMGLAPDGSTRYGYAYKKWVWNPASGDYSSDRDLNDIIFLVEGMDKVVTQPEDPTVEIVETGFSWYWAVEDLGATDDFDFNDVVFKISSITESRREQQVDGNGNPMVDGDKGPIWGEAKIMKCVEFTPMAAGGTMETYARWTNNGVNYCLAPGVYYQDGANKPSDGDLRPLSDLEASKNNACEIHKWFGVNSHTEMINTMSSSSHHKAIGTCKIYFKPDFTLEGFGTCKDKQAIDGIDQGLSISIGDPNAELGTDEINKEMAQEEYCVEKPKKGEPAQMFIINCDGWRWATERTHIRQAYPAFGRWVSGDNDAKDWYNDPTAGKVY